MNVLKKSGTYVLLAVGLIVAAIFSQSEKPKDSAVIVSPEYFAQNETAVKSESPAPIPNPQKEFDSEMLAGRDCEDRYFESKGSGFPQTWELRNALEHYVNAAIIDPAAKRDIVRTLDELEKQKAIGDYAATIAQSAISFYKARPKDELAATVLDKSYRQLISLIRAEGFDPNMRYTEGQMKLLRDPLFECGMTWSYVEILKDISAARGDLRAEKRWLAHLGDYRVAHHICDGCGCSYNPMLAYKFYAQAGKGEEANAHLAALESRDAFLESYFHGSAYCDGNPVGGEEGDELLFADAKGWHEVAGGTEAQFRSLVQRQAQAVAEEAEEWKQYSRAAKWYDMAGNSPDAKRMLALSR